MFKYIFVKNGIMFRDFLWESDPLEWHIPRMSSYLSKTPGAQVYVIDIHQDTIWLISGSKLTKNIVSFHAQNCQNDILLYRYSNQEGESAQTGAFPLVNDL